jgi:hypothetical protein
MKKLLFVLGSIFGLLIVLGMIVGSREPGEPSQRPSSADTAAALEWYQGGTLHKKDNVAWMTASKPDRLATAADFASAIAENEGKKFATMLEMRVEAEKLDACITEAAQADVSMKVSELAASCHVLMEAGL